MSKSDKIHIKSTYYDKNDNLTYYIIHLPFNTVKVDFNIFETNGYINHGSIIYNYDDISPRIYSLVFKQNITYFVKLSVTFKNIAEPHIVFNFFNSDVVNTRFFNIESTHKKNIIMEIIKHDNIKNIDNQCIVKSNNCNVNKISYKNNTNNSSVFNMVQSIGNKDFNKLNEFKNSSNSSNINIKKYHFIQNTHFNSTGYISDEIEKNNIYENISEKGDTDNITETDSEKCQEGDSDDDQNEYSDPHDNIEGDTNIEGDNNTEEDITKDENNNSDA